jgi:hypothetical protein
MPRTLPLLKFSGSSKIQLATIAWVSEASCSLVNLALAQFRKCQPSAAPSLMFSIVKHHILPAELGHHAKISAKPLAM